MRFICVAIITMFLCPIGLAKAQTGGLTDGDIRCYSDASCDKLVGKRVWVTINQSSICPTMVDYKSCRKVSPGFTFVIRGSDKSSDGSEYHVIKTDDGKAYYYLVANSHLLTLTNPKIALDKARTAEAKRSMEKQRQTEADIKHLASIPRSDLERACILSAAERLPRIAGLEIKSSKAAPLPSNVDQPGPDQFMTLVTFEIKAAGQDATYTYICARGARTPNMIHGVRPE